MPTLTTSRPSGEDRRESRVLMRAHVGNPCVNSRAAGLQMKIVGRRRSIDEQRVHADLVCADREAGQVRRYSADTIDEVVVKGGARDCGGVSSNGRTIGFIEDVVTNRDVGVGAPKHDLTGFAVCISEGERVVCHQPVAGSIRQLNRPTSVHVVEDVVDYGHVLGVRINPMVKVQEGLAVRAAYVMEKIAVEYKVILRIVKVNSILADLVGLSMVGDVLDFVPADRDIVGAVVAVDALVAAPLNDKTLDDDERGIAQIKIGKRAVTSRTGRRVHAV